MSEAQGYLHAKQSELGGIEQSIKQLEGLLQTAEPGKWAEYRCELEKLYAKRDELQAKITILQNGQDDQG